MISFAVLAEAERDPQCVIKLFWHVMFPEVNQTDNMSKYLFQLKYADVICTLFCILQVSNIVYKRFIYLNVLSHKIRILLKKYTNGSDPLSYKRFCVFL